MRVCVDVRKIDGIRQARQRGVDKLLSPVLRFTEVALLRVQALGMSGTEVVQLAQTLPRRMFESPVFTYIGRGCQCPDCLNAARSVCIAKRARETGI